MFKFKAAIVLALTLLMAAGPLGLRQAEGHSSVNATYYESLSTSVSPPRAKTGLTVTQSVTYKQKFDGVTTAYGVDSTTNTTLWCVEGPNALAGSQNTVTGEFAAPDGDEIVHDIHGFVVIGASCSSPVGGVAHTSLLIDNTAPDTSITSGPTGTTTSSSVTFTFTATESSTFACSIDGGTPAACTSPATFGPLANGPHTFDVAATDQAGNTDETPASRSFVVSAPAPSVAITSVTNPINAASQATAGASGTADAGSSVSVTLSDGSNSVNAGTTASGAGTWTVSLDATSLDDGAVTYTAVATDVNDQDSLPDVENATKDTQGPEAPSIGDPSEGSTSTTSLVTVAGSAEAGSTVAIKEGGDQIGTAAAGLDGTWSTDVSFADGAHAISAVATDGAGNLGAESTARIFTVDTADHDAPDTTITSGPPSPTNQTSATFEFTSSEEGSTFACSLDGGTPAACTSGIEYTGLSAGVHTFEVAATDAASNTDATPAEATWTIDVTAPETTITSGPSGRVPSNSATFEFTSNETGTFECSLDNNDYEACTSPKSYSGLAEGDHNFSVRATDAAGNTDPSPATGSWTTDAEVSESSYDSFNVAPNGLTHNSPRALEAGRLYRVQVTGLFQYKTPTATAPTTLADAECATAPFLGGQFEARRYVDTTGADWYDLYVNGGQVTWTPAPGTDMTDLPGSPSSAGCSRTHTYSIFVTGTGAPLALRTYDPAPADNRGQFFVNVYRQD